MCSPRNFGLVFDWVSLFRVTLEMELNFNFLTLIIPSSFHSLEVLITLLHKLPATLIMGDISIQETNRIRASLGMKALPVPGGGPQFKAGKDDDSGSSEEDEPGSTLESREEQGYGNWKKMHEEADAKVKREAKNEAIKKARDAAKKFAKLDGRGLGDADEQGDLDTRTWLLQQKKRQKRIEKEKTAKIEKELAERESSEYTAADLSGVNVGHSLEEFDGTEEQVLTLKDATIDQNEEEGDELENLDLKEREALTERLNIKKKKPVYDPHAGEEEGGSTILKHYDETIDGKKRKRFTLDGKGVSLQEREAMKQAVGDRLKAKPISLDFAKNDLQASDYTELVEAKIKKPKKKKTKNTRQKAVDEDDVFSAEKTNGNDAEDEAMEIDAVNGRHMDSQQKLVENSFVDDEDLQASLAVQRRAALKKRKRTKPQDIARQLREEAAEVSGGEEDGVEAEEGGLVIDETTQFLANLQRSKEEERARPKRAKSRDATPLKTEASPADDSADIDMDGVYNDADDDEELQARLKRETSTPGTPGMTGTGLEDEATLNKGLGATLSMLSQRGLLKQEKGQDINALHRDRQRFLMEKQKREADLERKARLQRERDRASGKLDHMSAREREEYARYENKQRDQMESRQMTDVFNREYKPDVQLKYVDEFGRSMNQKEAFKHLSHQFHGKGSGKQKTEKHLKKIEDAKVREARSTLDASQTTGMNNAMGATAKKNRQAGVRLA